MDRDLRRTLNIELKYREGLIKIISACHGTNRIQYYEACMGLFVSNIRINSFKLALDKKTAIISVEKNTVESAAPIPKTEGTTDVVGTYDFDSEDTHVVKMRKTKQRVYLSNLDVTENTTNEDMMMCDKEYTSRSIIVNNEKTMAAVVKREPSSSNSASVITDDSGVSSGEGLITNEFIGAPIGSGSTNHIRGRREPNSPSQSNSSTTGNNSPLAFEELVELPNGNKKRKDNNNVHRFLKKEPVILPESFYFGMSTMTDHHHPEDALATFSNTKLLHNKKFGFRLGDLTSSSHRHNSTGSSSCKSSKIIHDDSNGIKLLATRDYDSNYRIPIPDYDDWDDQLPNVNNIIPKKNKENANLNISSGKETTSTKFIYPKYSDVKSFLNPKFTETDEMQVFSTTTCSSTSSYIASKLKDQYRDICEESCTKKVKDVMIMSNKNKTKYHQGYHSKFSSNNITGTKSRHTVMAIDDEILEALKVNAILHDMTIVKPIHASPLDESHFDSKRNMVPTFSPFEPTINDSEYEKSYHNPLSLVSSFSSVRDSCCRHPEFAAKNICQDSHLLVNVTLSELRIPLIWDEKEHFKASNRNSTNRFSRFSFSHNTNNIKIQCAQGASGGDGWFVFAMATCGTQILHSSLVNGIDPSLTDITFDKDIFTFQKLKPDFVINLQFYGTSSKLIKKSNETVAQSPFMNLLRGKMDNSGKGDNSIYINEFQSYRSKPIGHSFSFNTLLDNFNTTEGTDLNPLSQNECLDQVKIKQRPFIKKPSSDSRTNSRRSFFEHLKPKNNCISKDDIVEWKSYLRSSAKKVKTSETPPYDGVEKEVITGYEIIDQIILNPGSYKLIASCHLRANHIHESLQVGDLNIIPIRNSSSSSTLPIMGHFSFKLSNL